MIDNLNAGMTPLNATWTCKCYGLESCEFPIIFGGD